MKKSDIRKYALEWQEETGLYYLPRGKMPTKAPTGCVLVHNKAAHIVHSRPGSVVSEHFKSGAAVN